jgi:hypothetical protein
MMWVTDLYTSYIRLERKAKLANPRIIALYLIEKRVVTSRRAGAGAGKSPRSGCNSDRLAQQSFLSNLVSFIRLRSVFV